MKKILLTFQSSYITPLESDTLLGHLFALAFARHDEGIKQIFEDFKNKKPPFLISNWFDVTEIDGQGVVLLPKPIFFAKSEVREEKNLLQAMIEEPKRKKRKKLDLIPAQKKYFEAIFKNNKSVLDNFLENIEKIEKEERSLIFKNMVPRFNQWDTEIFALEAKFAKQKAIYVKIFDENKFNKFFNFIKESLETLGWGSKRWVGFGRIKEVKLEKLNPDERELFEYLGTLWQNQGLKYVWSNYLPDEKDFEIFDFNSSWLDINWKNWKGFVEWNSEFFKGKLNFIKAGSVLRKRSEKGSEEIGKVYGRSYKGRDWVNFGYLF